MSINELGRPSSGKLNSMMPFPPFLINTSKTARRRDFMFYSLEPVIAEE